ncbi:MAG: hypothetical protein ABII18_05115 [bacterium]
MPAIKHIIRGSLSLICLVSFLNCGSIDDSGENYGDLLDSPSGLVLTEEEHVDGWGRADCLVCHSLSNIHLVDRSDIGIDIDAIREDTFIDGEDGCADCHGDNGL